MAAAVATITPPPVIRIRVLAEKVGTTFLVNNAVRVPLESANTVVESWPGWATAMSPATSHPEKVQPRTGEPETWKLSPESSQMALDGVVLPQSAGLAAIRMEYWC